MEKNCLHVVTGDGKGKTTAAMGLALRMLGHGKKVLVVQFMKQPTSGELKALAQLPGAIIYLGAPMDRFTYQMDEEGLRRTKEQQTAELAKITEVIRQEHPALTVLDELNVAMAYRLVPSDEALQLIDAALAEGEVVVTGRDAPDALLEKADYISRIEAVRHPFDEGQPARRGIEW